MSSLRPDKERIARHTGMEVLAGRAIHGSHLRAVKWDSSVMIGSLKKAEENYYAKEIE